MAFAPHDHSVCVSSAMSAAQTYCEANGLKFTETRKRVLRILLEKHRAIGAYDILEVLRQEGLAAQPPVAYRALDFLVSNGFAHKIEKLNAYVACAHPGQDHTPAFMICRSCDAVAEAQTHMTTLTRVAESTGFQIEATVQEAQGLCPDCQG
ncbi:transcriptional repressor [Nereida sp. MMG025]|uniref:transcriptional repressor n=1 Tax=Nereida sp. MMG025 TaxID=2909981 RepID=UPI001F014F39|nr:transcriptional repressor [Nereida sp. MMG025]MCF6443731.1 transcriptional repressor [Nereida sp. MMG025]